MSPKPDYYDDDGWPVWKAEPSIWMFRATTEDVQFRSCQEDPSLWRFADPDLVVSQCFRLFGPPLPDGPRQMPREGRRVKIRRGTFSPVCPSGTLRKGDDLASVKWWVRYDTDQQIGDEIQAGFGSTELLLDAVTEWDPPLPAPTVVDEDGTEWTYTPADNITGYLWHRGPHPLHHATREHASTLTALYRATHDGRAPWEAA